MAKENVVITPTTKKQKWLNVLKILGICFAVVVGIVAGAVIYVWATGGFNPPYVPLTELKFSQNEYVLSDLDNIRLVPNEGCTELDAVITIGDTNIVQLVEDDNTNGVVKEDEGESEPENEPELQNDEVKIYEKFNVKINSDIQIVPVKKTVTAVIDGEEQEIQINVGGWVKLIAEQGLYTTECWVFVDVPVLDMDIEILSTDKVEAVPETERTYFVYPNSVINLAMKGEYPQNSLIVPSTNLPQEKSETAFSETKNIYFEVSDIEKATITNSGELTISPNAEGTFTVYAYVISAYNNIGKEPNREEYIERYGLEAGLANWQTDFDKIRVKTEVLTFNIKEISVDAVLTDRDAQAGKELSIDVLDKDMLLYAGNTETTRLDEHNVYHYFVDIALSYGTEQAYKDSLLNKIELFAGYINNSSANENAININGKIIVLDDTYIKISERVSPSVLGWKITVDKYLDAQNVLVFAYPQSIGEDGETTYLYDYVNITVNKVFVSELLFTDAIPTNKNINLAYEDVQNGIVDTIDLNGTVSVSPSDATYTTVMYFAEENTDVIEVDSTKKIKTSDGVVYHAICKTVDVENQDETASVLYGWLNPKAIGKVKIIAGVLRNDANGELLVDEDGFYELEYAGVSSDMITVDVTKQIAVEKYDVVDAEDKSILKNGEVTVPKNSVFKIVVEFDEEITSIDSYTYSVSDGKNSCVSLSSRKIDTENKKKMTFTFSAEQVVAEMSIIITDAEGHAVSGMDEILLSIEDTQLEQLELSTNSENGVSVKVNTSEKTFSWVVVNDDKTLSSSALSFSVKYIPSNTTSKDVVLMAYKVPEGYDSQYDLSTLDFDLLTESDAISITNDENGDVSKAEIEVLKPEDIIVVAWSPSSNIYSNPLYVSISLPKIVVEFSENGNAQELVSSNGKVENLLTYDGLALQGDKFKISMANSMNDVESDLVDITSTFIKFKFENEYDINEEGYFVSKNSGVQIDNVGKRLLLTDLDESTIENIVFFTDFGYESELMFTYNLIADYLVKTENLTYFAPGVADLFSDYVRVESPVESDIALYYELTSNGYELTSDKAIDENKVYYEKTSEYVQVENPIKTELYKYYELIGGDYQKTSDLEIIEGKNYYTFTAKPSAMFTNLDGTKLYLPSDYDYLTNLSPEYLKHFSYEEEGETKYNIFTNLHISLRGEAELYNVSKGIIKVNRIPSEEFSVGLDLIVLNENSEFGYKYSHNFRVSPVVSSNFTCNGEDDNGNSYLVQEILVDDNNKFEDGQNTYIFNLQDKVNYNTGIATVSIRSIKFSQGYVSIVNVDATNNGSDLVRFIPVTETDLDGSATYYQKVDGEFVQIDSPIVEDLNTYYKAELFAHLENYDITIYDSVLGEGIANLQVKLEIESNVTCQGVNARITDYYIISFEFTN